MVRSLVEHCSQVWSSVNAGTLRSLEVLQKRVVKWIRNEPLASYSNDEYVGHLLSLNLLPFQQLFEFYDLRLFYKIVYGMMSITVPEYIQPLNPSTLRTTRQNIDICEGRDITTLVILSAYSTNTHRALRNSFFHRATDLWNKLPYPIRQSDSLTQFVRLTKKHLIDTIVPSNIV